MILVLIQIHRQSGKRSKKVISLPRELALIFFSSRTNIYFITPALDNSHSGII